MAALLALTTVASKHSAARTPKYTITGHHIKYLVGPAVQTKTYIFRFFTTNIGPIYCGPP